MRFYDPRFGRFTSPDPDHTIMSPYTYVLNNPVSFTDPTGHAARCGGAYSIDFSSTTWRLIMYGAFLWRQWPMPHQLGPGERSDNGLAFVLNLQFTDASGGDPFRTWWQDRGLTEDEGRMYETMWRAMETGRKLWRTFKKALTFSIPTPGFALWWGQKEGLWITLDKEFSKDQQEILLSAFKELCLAAPNISGETAFGEQTLADVLYDMLGTNKHLLIAMFSATYGSGTENDPLRFGISEDNPGPENLKGFSVVGVNQYIGVSSWYTGIMPVGEPTVLGETTARGLLWHTLMHEFVHLHGGAAYNEGSKPDPEDVLPWMLEWRPSGMK